MATAYWAGESTISQFGLGRRDSSKMEEVLLITSYDRVCDQLQSYDISFHQFQSALHCLAMYYVDP